MLEARQNTRQDVCVECVNDLGRIGCIRRWLTVRCRLRLTRFISREPQLAELRQRLAAFIRHFSGGQRIRMGGFQQELRRVTVMNRRAISSMFAAALVGAVLVIGATGPVAADDEVPHETIGSATQGAGAGKALAAATLLQPDPCPGTET
jgi:hypothetical protein